ncbi:uncharacterized protein BJ212DRAFT_1474219 [Suillus subaureus]|uniref:Uncharacterized protein n=1 Tax=Suillus subaureus TaxID=48587 RepID=A0A9P7EPA6_9AGAM|nr:uncharacterized protein BJ212DRAFT_1474219 [Suillus subaureus]KAG1827027.1 hypothetical protein BJ212DRAFT_1474219 [Suillus subaureus]
MSDNAIKSSHTLSSENHQEFDQNSVKECLNHIEDFKKGLTQKGDALLEIQTILQKAIAESDSLTQLNFKPGFKHFLELLDHTIISGEASDHWEEPSLEEPEHQESSVVPKEKAESVLSRDEHEYVLQGKRRKLTPDRLQFYLWLEPDQYHQVSNKRAEQLMLDCYEEWSEETKYYLGQVTSTPGCPSFPTSQWTLLLDRHAPDLEKVLSGHYSTTIELKQSQPLGKGFEITLSQPTSTHKVKTYGDWSVATDLWVEALSFIMPWKESELCSYKCYVSRFFVNVHYSLHS